MNVEKEKIIVEMETRLIEALKGKTLTTQELAKELGIKFGKGGEIKTLFDALERNSGHWDYRSGRYYEGKIKKAYRRSRNDPDGKFLFVHFLADDEQELIKEGRLGEVRLVKCESIIKSYYF